MSKTKICAEIVAHSVNKQGDEVISILCTFPRIILAEVNTHRMLSKNTSSSRAIPFEKMVETIENDPFIPIAFQKDHKGMQGNKYITDDRLTHGSWLRARNNAIAEAKMLNRNIEVTKQLANRLLEPFMWTTMLITGPKSGWQNFFNLRCPLYIFHDEEEEHFFLSKQEAINRFGENEEVEYPEGLVKLKDMTDIQWLGVNGGQAEIHMMALAECIYDAVGKSKPLLLNPGEWHIPFEDKMTEPFFKTTTDENGTVFWIPLPGVDKGAKEWLENQKVKVSVAMAARTSYTVVGEEKGIDIEKMIGLHDRLLEQEPPHSSPLEHCARCMSEDERFMYRKVEKTKGDSEGLGWCNNLKGFIPYRYFIDNSLTL